MPQSTKTMVPQTPGKTGEINIWHLLKSLVFLALGVEKVVLYCSTWLFINLLILDNSPTLTLIDVVKKALNP